ncbi:MAG: glycoside hydrolase family 31 protein [Tepidibacillus sp.]
MQDTSFAIHPGNKKKLENTPYHDIGDLKEFVQEHNLYRFTCEQGFVNILFYRDDIVRIVMNPFHKPTMKSSFAVVAEPEIVKVKIEDKEDSFSLSSSKLQVMIQKSPFRVNFYDQEGRLLVSESEKGMGFKESKEVVCFKEMDPEDHFYGFGEKAGFLDKRGEKLTMWNTDVYAPHNQETDPLYQSHPYFMTLRNGKAHGIFFDNTFKTTFDMKKEKEYSFAAEGGQIDYYVMAGPSPKQVLEQYTWITGRMPLPAKWVIGYHQSRYSYESEQEVRELVNSFIQKEIPLDAVYLDIHYMNEYRVFTFDRDRFPNPEKMMKDLKSVGKRIVPIVDPGVKVDPEYSIYQEGIRQNHFSKYIEGDIFYGNVWPGKSAFPDFTKSETRKWWGEKHRFYTDLGIEGIWNDMNEPAVFNETKTMDVNVVHENDGDPKTHREMHNLYGLLMGEATYYGMKKLLHGKRPFLLTRAGYSGVQRYAAVWTGDNRSFWEHLALSIPMCMNLGLSGVALSGPDIGGFAHDTTGELLARWTQVGAFTPYFRNHSAIGTARQEPWSFGPEIEKIIKKYIQLRYQWLPHLYSLFAQTSKTGIPVMRPLFIEYPEDRHTFNLSDQFMIGENVIIAPIIKPDTYHRVVYLPEGTWVDYWTDQIYEGGKHILVESNLETLPIFIKVGTMISHGSIKQSTTIPEKDMTIHLYQAESGESHYTLYDDDGETFAYEKGEYLEKQIRYQANGNVIKLTIENSVTGYQPTWKHWTLKVHHATPDLKLIINGKEVDAKDINFNTESNIASIRINL